jgi:hypothetical protein
MINIYRSSKNHSDLHLAIVDPDMISVLFDLMSVNLKTMKHNLIIAELL